MVYTQAHSRVHDPAEEAVLACQAEACTYTCRSNAVMKNHVLKAHVKRGPSYACHLCDKLYNREGQLSFSLQVLLYNWKDNKALFGTTGRTIKLFLAPLQVLLYTGRTIKLYMVQQEGQLSFIWYNRKDN